MGAGAGAKGRSLEGNVISVSPCCSGALSRLLKNLLCILRPRPEKYVAGHNTWGESVFGEVAILASLKPNDSLHDQTSTTVDVPSPYGRT